MSFNILLVTPPYHAGIIEVTGKWPPLSLVYLAGHLRQAGFSVKIYDAMSMDHTLAETEAVIAREDPDMVMIGGFTSSINTSLEVLKAVKKNRPRIITCLGGVHATFCYQQILEEMPEIVDYIVRGEGEQTVIELARAVRSGLNPSGMPGVAYSHQGEIITGSDRELLDNLDTLVPAWDLLDWSLYRYNVTGRRLALVGLSRGCTHKCKFCSQHLFWRGTYRSRSPQSFVNEIETLHRDYGAGMFMMGDEFATCQRDTWEKVLDLLREKELDIHISLETRADAVLRDRDILDKYRRAGVIHVYVGVETVHQKTLDMFEKGITVQQSREAVNLLNGHGIITECSFIIGNVEDTGEDIDRTLATALEFNPDLAHFLLITPWPYTPMYEEVKQFIIEHDYGKYHFIHPVVKPKHMDTSVLWSKLIDCFKVFYLNKARLVSEMPEGFKKDYMMKSIQIMHRHFFVDNFGRNTITLPREMGNLIDYMIGRMAGRDRKMIREEEFAESSRELDRDITDFINKGIDNCDEDSFNKLALREFNLQFEANQVYREYCLKQGITPEKVENWSQIPPIPTAAFKQQVITSFPLKDAEIALLTSGTTDPVMRGKIYRDKSSLQMIIRANSLITKAFFFPDTEKMKILLLVPSPKVAPAMAMAFGLEQLKNEFGTEDSTYFITPNGFETDELIKTLRDAESKQEPVCMVGATSGFVHFFNNCTQLGQKFTLPIGSRVCDGGGYQGTFGQCSREDFYRQCSEFLGIPPHMCINTLGMSESGTNYFDNTIRDHFKGVNGERYKFTLPWTRTVVVGPRTGQRMPKGEVGLIRHYDLTNRATVLAVQTDNLGYETDGGFEIIGRVQSTVLGFGMEPTSVKDWMLAGHREAAATMMNGQGHMPHGHMMTGTTEGTGCSESTAQMMTGHGGPCSTVADGMMTGHGGPCSTVADGMMTGHGVRCSTVADGMMTGHGGPCSTVADGMMTGHGGPCSTVADGMMTGHGVRCSTVADGIIKKGS